LRDRSLGLLTPLDFLAPSQLAFAAFTARIFAFFANVTVRSRSERTDALTKIGTLGQCPSP